ncbi:actin-like protein 9 [Pleurodeles waltl]|uniref:actin-like protein 9 n=1 Tax=Pleurodeles waltl TaxID=8319 RepID=UPI00370987F4
MSSPSPVPPSSPDNMQPCSAEKKTLMVKPPLTESRVLRPKDSNPADSPSKHSPELYLPVKKAEAIVIDTGSESSKAGFAGQATPLSIVKTVVGYPLEKSLDSGDIRDTHFVGQLALDEPHLRIIEPIKQGMITDWDAAETLWRHILDHELKASPEEHAILLTDPPLNPPTNREKMSEVLFESMNCPCLCVAYQSVLSAYSYGKISGMVVECGHGMTYTAPVFQGHNVLNATERMGASGAELTESLMKMLFRFQHVFAENIKDIMENIKRECCYVALDYEKEMNRPEDDYLHDFQLPDGKIITIGKERFQCPEALFSPAEEDGDSHVGIHKMAQNSLNRVPEESKKAISSNILLCGGSTLFEGFYERLSQEFQQWQPHQFETNVISVPERKYSAWIGGSILASLKAFQSCWVHQQQYKEYGPSIIHRKCY